ncbi:MAG: endonuclease III [Bacilli bacterium]|jgi:endonuclease-3
MKNSDKIKIFKTYLDQKFPDAKCELIYDKDYELAMAVVLSAQTTDKAVNRVTPILFKHFDSLQKIAEAPIQDLERDIRALGLHRHKALSLQKIASLLIDDFNGIVPSLSSELLRLPGVGNKTKNVIQAELFHIPSIAVDTHVERISKRLGLVRAGDNPDQIESKIRRLLDARDYIKTNHQIISFGREVCLARKPRCHICEMKSICSYFKSLNKI